MKKIKLLSVVISFFVTANIYAALADEIVHFVSLSSDRGSILVNNKPVIKLSYPYLPLSTKQLKETFLVQEGYHFRLPKGKAAFMGPLSPCVGLAVAHPETSEVFVVHSASNVELADVMEAINSFLGAAKNRSGAKAIYFSKKYDKKEGQEDRIKAILLAFKEAGFKDDNIKGTLLVGTDLDDSRYDDGSVIGWAPYIFADKSVVVTDRLTVDGFPDIFSTCLFTELFMKNSERKFLPSFSCEKMAKQSEKFLAFTTFLKNLWNNDVIQKVPLKEILQHDDKKTIPLVKAFPETHFTLGSCMRKFAESYKS